MIIIILSIDWFKEIQFSSKLLHIEKNLDFTLDSSFILFYFIFNFRIEISS